MLRRALLNPAIGRLPSRRGVPSMTALPQSGSVLHAQAPLLVHRPLALRALSSNSQKSKTGDANNDEADTKEIVLTPGEKVVVAGRLGLWLGIAAFGSVCAYYIGKELMPRYEYSCVCSV
jgi:hypothetical protein